MAMKVEAAIVTKKASDSDYNSDSVNASGKLWSRDIIHSEKGVKAAGDYSGIPYYCIASAQTKGTAETACELFSQAAEKATADFDACSDIIAEYFNGFANILNGVDLESDACSTAVFCGNGDTVFTGVSGNSVVYTWHLGELTEAAAQKFEFSDKKSSYGVCKFTNVSEGDIFILINENIRRVIGENLLTAICKSAAGDAKKLVAIIADQAAKRGVPGAVNSVVISIKQTFAPAEDDFSTDLSAEAEKNSEEITENTVSDDNSEDNSNSEIEQAEDQPSETEAGTAESENKTVNPDPDFSVLYSDDKEKKEQAEAPASKGMKFAFVGAVTVFVIMVLIIAALGVKGIWHYKYNNSNAENIVTLENEAADYPEEENIITEENTTVEENNENVG